MFKETGDRLQNGTMNLSITQKEGRMSVIVSFKGVPGLNEALFTGTPEEIEAEFFERLEQPMQAISKFNFDMEVFNEAILKETKAKKEKLDALKKEAEVKKEAADKNKKYREMKEKSQASLELSAEQKEQEDEPVCEIEDMDENDPDYNVKVNDELTRETLAEKSEEISVLKFNDRQKQEILDAGLNSNRTDHKDKIIAKIIHMRNCNQITAETYFRNNLEKLLEEALLHKANVDRMKEQTTVQTLPESNASNEEFDPFADDFQL